MPERAEALTKQHIGRAIFAFQKNRFKMPDKIINPKTGKLETDEEQLDNILDYWFDWFKYTDPKVFQFATDYILSRCSFWPKMKEWQEALDRYESEKVTAKDYGEPSELEMTAGIKKIVDYMQKGRIKELVLEFPSIPVEFQEQVKELYPDCTESFIQKNYNELYQMIESHESCATCNGLRNCKQDGFKTLGKIDKMTGMVTIFRQACPDKDFLIKEYEDRKKRQKDLRH